MTEQERIEQAVEVLEPIARTATLYRVADALKTAISIMRERLEGPTPSPEQVKACGFCVGADEEMTIYTHDDCDGGYVVTWHDALFCPRCGRKLTGDKVNE